MSKSGLECGEKAKSRRWIARLALQIASQLPEDSRDAHSVLEHAKALIALRLAEEDHTEPERSGRSFTTPSLVAISTVKPAREPK